MVSLYAGRFVIVHLSSTFSVDPQIFSTGANIYQKLRFFAIFAAVDPHFLNQNGEIWYDDADLGLPPPSQIL